MSTETLHPCPLCGSQDGCVSFGGDYKRIDLVCIGCGEVVAEYRRAGGGEAANAAWNSAGAYAAGLLADRDRLAAENAELRRMLCSAYADAAGLSDAEKHLPPDELQRVMLRRAQSKLDMLAARPSPSAQARSTLEDTDE